MIDISSVSGILATLVNLYSLVMLVWVVASWVPQLRRHSALRWVERLCEPLLRPVRRVLPVSGGIDFSPMVVLLGLQLLARWLARAPF